MLLSVVLFLICRITVFSHVSESVIYASYTALTRCLKGQEVWRIRIFESKSENEEKIGKFKSRYNFLTFCVPAVLHFDNDRERSNLVITK